MHNQIGRLSGEEKTREKLEIHFYCVIFMFILSSFIKRICIDCNLFDKYFSCTLKIYLFFRKHFRLFLAVHRSHMCHLTANGTELTATS